MAESSEPPHAIADGALLPSRFNNPGIASKMALDEFFYAIEVATNSLVGPSESGRLSEESERTLEFHEAMGWVEDPASFHVEPEALHTSEMKFSARDILGVRYGHAEWDSGYAPHEEHPGAKRWLGYAPVRRAHAWLYEHAGEDRPWVVCMPGFRMGIPWWTTSDSACAGCIRRWVSTSRFR